MVWLAKLAGWFRGSEEKRRAHEAYIALIAQARNPFFYERCAVPDTLDGRFEVILLHLFLLMHRLRQDPQDNYTRFNQMLIETYFSDMDHNLREMGVGDTGVSRRVKNMANALYGRLQAYENAVGAHAMWVGALRRNVYATVESVPDEPVNTLAQYVESNLAFFTGQEASDLMAGRIRFIE